MKWFENEVFKTELAASTERKGWVEDEANWHFPTILKKLPPPLQNKSRIGPLSLSPIHGAEGICCWMVPVDGSTPLGKLLGANSPVKLIDKDGNIFFEGSWGNTTEELIALHIEFYIWLEAPKHDKT